MDTISDILSKYNPTSEIGNKISKELFFLKLTEKLSLIFKEKEIKLLKPAIIKENSITIYCKNNIIATLVKLKEKQILNIIREIESGFVIDKIYTQINESF